MAACWVFCCPCSFSKMNKNPIKLQRLGGPQHRGLYQQVRWFGYLWCTLSVGEAISSTVEMALNNKDGEWCFCCKCLHRLSPCPNRGVKSMVPHRFCLEYISLASQLICPGSFVWKYRNSVDIFITLQDSQNWPSSPSLPLQQCRGRLGSHLTLQSWWTLGTIFAETVKGLKEKNQNLWCVYVAVTPPSGHCGCLVENISLFLTKKHTLNVSWECGLITFEAASDLQIWVTKVHENLWLVFLTGLWRLLGLCDSKLPLSKIKQHSSQKGQLVKLGQSRFYWLLI